ncbi:SMP-30/gluconolaconase/LRE domain-containing protein, partial [Reticulomyxa filosa]
NGDAYVADSFAGAVYKVAANNDSDVAQVWCWKKEWYTGPPYFGPNGIALDAMQSNLVVSIFQSGQLWRIDIDSHTQTASPTQIQITNAQLLQGLDGLTFDRKNESILYVTGNSGHTVYKFVSDDKWKTTSLTYTYSCRGGGPTAVTNVGDDDIYVINSYLFDNTKTSYLLEKFQPFQCSSAHIVATNDTSHHHNKYLLTSSTTMFALYVTLAALILVSFSCLVTAIVKVRKQSNSSRSDYFYQNF